jgi:hypothetical protein
MLELVKTYKPGTKATGSAKGVMGPTLIWKVSFLCKDSSTASNSNVYRIHLNSHEGLGVEFFGKAVNLHTNTAARKRV